MQPISIALFEEKLLLIHRAKEHAPSTIRQVKQVLREFRGVGVETTAGLTDEAIALWKRACPKTPVTCRSHLRCLRAMCNRAVRKGWLDVSPFDLDKLDEWVRDDDATARPRRTWSLSPAEIRKVLGQADSEALAGDWRACRRRAYVWCLLALGMRPGELQRLEVQDFDAARKTITVRPKMVPVWPRGQRWWRPKTVASAATIPVGERTAAILAEWASRAGCRWLFPGDKRVGPRTSGGPGTRWLDELKELGQRAGVRLAQKTGRKSVGTNARGAGLTSLERRGLFRHELDRTGDAYDERSVEGLRPAVNKIEAHYLDAG